MLFNRKTFDIRFDFSECWWIGPTQDSPAAEVIEFSYQELPAFDLASWEEGFNVPLFVDASKRIMPPDAIVFLECAPTESQAAETLNAIEIETSKRVENARTWPRSRYCHIPFTAANARILASLFEANESYQICLHFNIYTDREVLLSWHDAFVAPFYMAGSFDEQKIASFCAGIGGAYSRMRK